jgi:hypothetical protein
MAKPKKRTSRPAPASNSDSTTTDEQRPATNGQDVENDKGPRKTSDTSSEVEMTNPTGNAREPGQRGESASGGFEEGPMDQEQVHEEKPKAPF